jgi:ATP-binding cassette subfamily B (MDR/TAP) protein 1
VYEIFGSLAALVLAFYYSWKLTFVLISAFPIAAIILAFVSRPLGPAIEIQKRELTRASKYANTAITAISVVKAYNGQDQEVWQYFDTIKNVATSYLVQARSNALQFGFVKFIMMVIFVQGFWFGLYLVNRGMDPGNILTTFYACLTAMQAVEIVLPQWLVLMKGVSAGSTLKLIRNEMRNQRRKERKVKYADPESCVGDVEIKGVT